MDLKAQRGFVDGPAISDLNGYAYLTQDILDSLIEVIADLIYTNQMLFLLDILSKELFND